MNNPAHDVSGQPQAGSARRIGITGYGRRLALNTALLWAADGVVLLLALLAGDVVQHYVTGLPISVRYSLLLLPAWWAGSVMIRITPGWGAGMVAEVRALEILLAVLFGAGAVAVFVLEMGASTSRVTYLTAYAISAILLPTVRGLVRSAAARRGAWGIPATIHGAGPLAEAVAQTFRDEPEMGYQIVGSHGPAPVTGLPLLGPLNSVSERVPVTVLAVENVAPAELTALLDGPLGHCRTVILVPGLLDAPSLWARTRDLHGVLGLEITNNLADPRARLLKRAVELAVIGVTMPLWLPLALVLSVVVLAQDGHAPLYCQRRIGRGGRPFTAWKFRTMAPDAERQLEERLAVDAGLRAEWERHHKLRNDWRVTRFGRWLRRSSLDELPQLFNVLRGEMSLVGPRPLPDYHHQALAEPVRRLREKVLPGVTGLWQIHGRGDAGREGLARWDAYYVRNWSVWLDLIVLARTVRAVVTMKGAY